MRSRLERERAHRSVLLLTLKVQHTLLLDPTPVLPEPINRQTPSNLRPFLALTSGAGQPDQFTAVRL